MFGTAKQGKLISIFAESSMSYVHASSPLTSPSKINVDHSNMLNSKPPSSGILSAAFDGSLYTCMHHLQFNEKLGGGGKREKLRSAKKTGSNLQASIQHLHLSSTIEDTIFADPSIQEKCHLDHEYIDLKEQKVILDQEKCHLDHERLQCKGQHCPSTTVCDFICCCKISRLCSLDCRYLFKLSIDMRLHEPGNVDLGVNQVVSELSSTATEILLSEKDMNTQGNEIAKLDIRKRNNCSKGKQDKSADVRKAAEVCLGDVLRVCEHESVTKNLRDIQRLALAIVLERPKPNGDFHGTV
ncbi:hypothetical protein RHGRI_020773 [Rhododendron griersonianum]|uniref:Uncharacterized protein n=1 Tax=Rhododendron griersonianum TaxID=479676 RepID=A0AAV6JIV8_9ERIC|nr:hypothetical protein RHGRI_020773 [Rhododendron griersonianum]